MAEKKLKVTTETKKIVAKKVVKAPVVVKEETGLQTSKPVKATKKTDALHAEVYDVTGKVIETIALSEKIFGVKSNPRLVAQAVRVYLANQRVGSASTKTRGEVEGSTRKIYRQKGTGRARHGGIRAPIFVHGGIAHGPKPKDFSLDLPKKMKRAALFVALTEKAKTGTIKVLSDLQKIEPKTKPMAELLSKMELSGKRKKTLLVLDTKHENIIRSVRNIENVTYEYARQLHTYEVMQYQSIIFMKDALTEMEKIFFGENKKKEEK
jgi:large subunit ribosomal protein L4